MAILSVLPFSVSAHCQAGKVINEAQNRVSNLKDTSHLTLYHETRGTGTPVIFLHGFGANIFSWRHLV